MYTCSNCQKSVDKHASRCPHCRVVLVGIRCSHCHFSGCESDFRNDRCPRCGNRVYIPGRGSGAQSDTGAVVAGCLVLVGIVAAGIWYFGFRDTDDPPPKQQDAARPADRAPPGPARPGRGNGKLVPAAGTEPLEQLIAALRHADPARRIQAAEGLKALGTRARRAWPPLVQACGDADAGASRAAEAALGAIGPPTAKEFPGLVAATQDARPVVRWRAVLALSQLQMAEAVAPIAAAARDSDERVWHGAVVALGTLAPRHPEALHALTGLLDSKDVPRRLACVAALTRLPREGAVLPALAKALKDPNPAVQATVRPLLESNLFLSGLPLRGADGALVLEAVLTHGSPLLRLKVVQLLTGMKSEAKEAVPALVQTLQDPDVGIRAKTIQALEAIGPGVKGTILGLGQAARADKDLTLRQQALQALEGFGQAARAAVADLALVVGRDLDKKTRQIALRVLKSLGPEARAAVPALIQAFEDADQEIAAEAIRVTSKVGAAAVPQLADKLADRTPIVRLAVVQALALIGPEAGAVVEALQKRLKAEPLPAIRNQIRYALKVIQTR